MTHNHTNAHMHDNKDTDRRLAVYMQTEENDTPGLQRMPVTYKTFETAVIGLEEYASFQPMTQFWLIDEELELLYMVLHHTGNKDDETPYMMANIEHPIDISNMFVSRDEHEHTHNDHE